MATGDKIERKYRRSYVDAKLEKGGTTAQWYRLGKDNDELTRSKNWTEETQQNVWGETVTTATQESDTLDVAPYYARQGDPMYALLVKIDVEKLGLDDIKRDYVECWCETEEEEATGICQAFKEIAEIKPQSFGGPASNAVDIPFNISLSGDRISGTFNLTTHEFTPEL